MLNFFTPLFSNISAQYSWIPLFFGAFLVILAFLIIFRAIRAYRYF